MSHLRPSSVQASPLCASIDRAIASGLPPGDIARQYGVSRWAAIRRRRALQNYHPHYLRALAGVQK